MATKKYVDMTVKYSKDGGMTPVSLIWPDGREFKIDRVIGHDRVLTKLGGAAIQYKCRIKRQVRDLYFEKDKWFVIVDEDPSEEKPSEPEYPVNWYMDGRYK